MKKLNFYFDFTSPYSYLSMMKIDNGQLDDRYDIEFMPVMVGRLFALNELSAPAQVKNKALYLFKEALRSADRQGVELTSPRTLPFNSLPYLRMALGLKEDKVKQREFIVKTFQYGWRDGLDYEDYDGFKAYITKDCLLEAEYEELENSKELKKELKKLINSAYERKIFGVPTFEVNDDFYWGDHNFESLAKKEFLDYNQHKEFLKFKEFFKDEK
ncbi:MULTISPECIES: DsbA family protein [Halobacteriovorax]|uniref:2-hydroxychromene-2-carboxylate isomerase n=1 Tax=Halobacteriovorax vibrionivorans TaxID=2152716 RepID=A0ABY0IJQ8_9BACT|nr:MULTISPECIES: DsbA family protein [Halobacteriovorax]AYF45251.1 DSBA-like thioredoxin domain protein [Halobacteriovorax sp. BALOs_7]RZF22338.1 hypothetical protein DAY19_00800 [Halobacteriovorax vibrionivorans]TGD48590.1 hypothetical protein EP118_03715 [Halobacteriovorax sp. Y22]